MICFYENIQSQLSAYADNHQIYISSEKIDNVTNSLEEDGIQLVAMKTFNLNWVLTLTTTKYIFRVRRLTTSWTVLRRTGIQLVAGINPTTSQVIHRGLVMSQEVKKAVHIDGHKIQQAQEIKLLGVMLDVNLQFSEHIKQIWTKTSRRIGVLSTLRNLIPTTARLTIYKTADMPHFTYSSLILHFCKASDGRNLERINERGLQTVYNDWSTSYNDLLSRAKTTKLYNRKLQDIAIFMFKIKHSMLPSSVTELFNTSHSNYNLRNAGFRQECFNTTKYSKHSLRHFGPLLWSKIRREPRSVPTLSNFKKDIRKTDFASLIDDLSNNCVLCKN